MLTAAEIRKLRVGKFSISASLLIRSALKKGLDCVFLPEKVIQISNGTTTYFFKGTSLPCNNVVAAGLSNNKFFLRRLLKKAGIPSPRTVSLRNTTAWTQVLASSLRFPLVVKPISASHANGATLNIDSVNELERAVARAFTYIKKNRAEDRVLVEEYFHGEDLRFLVVGDKVVSVLKREPAYVIGNGRSTIRQLIHEFNEQWKSPLKYDLPLCPIPLDTEVSRYLAKSKLSFVTVLANGIKAQLRWNANVSTGGRASDVTDQVHPNLKVLAIRIAALSQLAVGGVDLLCKDLASGDVSANNICVLEINDSPGFDIHHFPVAGQGHEVTADILDYIFPTPQAVPELSAAKVELLLSDLIIKVPLTENILPVVPHYT